MRKNIIQVGHKAKDGRTYIDDDWFSKGVPDNVKIAKHVYLDTSYGFAAFHSLLPDAMTIGEGSGCYDRASFIVGKKGKVEIGEFNILNGSTFICNESIKVGSHCMFAWGSVITDSWIYDQNLNIEQRKKILYSTSKGQLRLLPLDIESNPVVIGDNVWVGFDAVILPGVKLGRGCIVGSKSVIAENIPAYAIVAGNPSRIIRYMDADDTEEARVQAMNKYLSPAHTMK
ncbi:MAG: acyltransferase [Bacteroidia bacterium]|nr:acyltransferase [Bacteroidia bacterium]